jgi:hypothetical protein
VAPTDYATIDINLFRPRDRMAEQDIEAHLASLAHYGAQQLNQERIGLAAPLNEGVRGESQHLGARVGQAAGAGVWLVVQLIGQLADTLAGLSAN